LVAASPVPVVFDHFGGAKEELGPQQPGFADLVELVRSGKAYVKISVTAGPRTDYTPFAPLAKMLIAATPSASSGDETGRIPIQARAQAIGVDGRSSRSTTVWC